MKRVNIGGQAVIEGVMMKCEDKYTIAVRKSDKDIVINNQEYKSASKKYKVLKMPILRGILAFVESMIIGVKTLTYSAEFFDVEEDDNEKLKESKIDHFINKVLGDKAQDVLVGISVVFATFISIGLFMVAPLLITRLIREFAPIHAIQNLVEGIVRIGIFLSYILLISKMKDIQRVFQYHGAEHKTINCLEHDESLTIENVKKHSRLHKRCGTSFLFIVMFVSILVFMFIRIDVFWVRLLSRIVLVPIIAGISYEIIRFAGKSESKLVDIISYPGMCIQRLTTKEPDDEQIEVAIVAVKGVLNNGENPSTNIL
ncbi:uncharacterized protein YqhQ [Natranaerovirga pectinivora]|uniref:Uncharacterized protein YqhQ n=1 Tax=Natranaerovirga pectinivora TaxID=682400 RepID=A0A4R3MJM0_9FIRM|nr:DUF1385 domain-containing protein [Natranaerovirga pectinivora]TCT14320.1 uncharacterized protein YqhQ [Natranaerovirga pectinivora]